MLRHRIAFFASVATSAGAFSSLPGHAGASGPPRVVINEIMYHPLSGGSEWVELWNVSREAISLQGWTLEDSRGKPGVVSTGDLHLEAESFVVLAADLDAFRAEFGGVETAAVREIEGAWPTLNNTQASDQPYADIVILRDGRGTAVDSVAYGADWGTPGRSIERLSPAVGPVAANWCASLAREGATPGSINSAYLEPGTRGPLRAEPDPFRPEVDGVTFVSFQISLAEPTVRLQIFDVVGRLVRTLLDDGRAGRSGRLAWDGRDEAGTPVPTGIYVLYLQALDTEGSGLVERKGTVTVAREF